MSKFTESPKFARIAAATSRRAAAYLERLAAAFDRGDLPEAVAALSAASLEYAELEQDLIRLRDIGNAEIQRLKDARATPSPTRGGDA